MDAFLDRSCFAGLSAPCAAPFLSQARFSGYIVFTNWPRADVQRFLPAELRLAPNLTATPDVHPVVFIFGEVAEGATLLAGFTIPLGVRYAEFAVAIPFVTYARGRYLHTYIPRMYASHLPAVWTGNALYGFGKEVGKMTQYGAVFMLTSENDALLWHATTESPAAWSGSCGDLPNLEAARAAFALPILGRKSSGEYVHSYFGWDFSGARVRPAASCVTLEVPLVDGMGPRQCSGVPSGTFEAEGMIWRLTWPLRCPSCEALLRGISARA